MAMRGSSRRPSHSSYVASRTWRTPCRAGIGADLVARANARMTGRSMNASVSASPYAAPAGVSALYSVSFIAPSSSMMKVSSREVGLGSRMPGSSCDERLLPVGEHELLAEPGSRRRPRRSWRNARMSRRTRRCEPGVTARGSLGAGAARCRAAGRRRRGRAAAADRPAWPGSRRRAGRRSSRS